MVVIPNWTAPTRASVLLRSVIMYGGAWRKDSAVTTGADLQAVGARWVAEARAEPLGGGVLGSCPGGITGRAMHLQSVSTSN